jgi:hypothetical protein
VNTRRLRAELARVRYGAESVGIAGIWLALRTRMETDSGALWRSPDGARVNLACAAILELGGYSRLEVVGF